MEKENTLNIEQNVCTKSSLLYKFTFHTEQISKNMTILNHEWGKMSIENGRNLHKNVTDKIL